MEKELTAQKSKPSVVSAKGRDRPASPGGLISPVFLQAFTLTFLAEWGDRSQVCLVRPVCMCMLTWADRSCTCR